MSDNNISQVTGGKVGFVSQVNQYFTALTQNIFPRGISGVVADLAGSIGDSTRRFKNGYIQNIYVSDFIPNVNKIKAVQTFLATETFVVPDGVTRMVVLGIGSGGNGGSYWTHISSDGHASGGGGGGGGQFQLELSVVAGEIYQIDIGADAEFSQVIEATPIIMAIANRGSVGGSASGSYNPTGTSYVKNGIGGDGGTYYVNEFNSKILSWSFEVGHNGGNGGFLTYVENDYMCQQGIKGIGRGGDGGNTFPYPTSPEVAAGSAGQGMSGSNSGIKIIYWKDEV